ncbi:putative alkaline shock family protein YloU [Sinobaca qinghaiensis]|uniref:Alkaline shock protein 23 n=1 Tax=Sinobaca qinghaiensis TaxID=342944 RepID=A0A419V4K2_9BACL|nr:Asp23/Gls24 family envelope stress response protein [Sinobaca qinghaiensis]RKD73372.1 putative alkaline shock family protein YloU [Sinobaca qinghaiensis]
MEHNPHQGRIHPEDTQANSNPGEYNRETIERTAASVTKNVKGIVGMSGNVADRMTERLGNDNPRKGVQAFRNDNSLSLELTVTARYGENLQSLQQRVKSAVIEAVQPMTDLSITSVKLFVDNIEKNHQEESIA